MKIVDDVKDLSITSVGVYIKLLAALMKIENRGIPVQGSSRHNRPHGGQGRRKAAGRSRR